MLRFHQARLLIASLRRECRQTAKHLERIQESGHGDPRSAITEHSARMALMIETTDELIRQERDS